MKKEISARKLEFFLNITGVFDFQFNSGSLKIVDNLLRNDIYRLNTICIHCNKEITKGEIFILDSRNINIEYYHLKHFSKPIEIKEIPRANSINLEKNPTPPHLQFLNALIGTTVVP